MRLPFISASVALLFACALVHADVAADAKRKAATDLMKEGKSADAIALMQEVVKMDKPTWRDHLLLGRAYDKLNKAPEATLAWRKVAELLPNPASTADERTARTEADRRLKVLDALTQKIQASEEEFLKKLDQLEREAIGSKDAAAVKRIFKLKAGVYHASDRKDRFGMDVQANQAWQETGYVLQAGHAYRIRAVGEFMLRPGLTASADGTDALPANAQGPLGMLCGQFEHKAGAFQLGSSNRYVCKESGKLLLILNASAEERKGFAGSVTVLIEQE